MKKFLKSLLLVAMVMVLFLFVLSWSSRGTPVTGLVSDGRLAACPESPNCVSSEEGEVEPLSFSGPSDLAWMRLKRSIQAVGGTVETDKGTYLAATFQSALFRFVDDMEFRMVSDEQLIHVRSASRVGHSDMGANLKRVEKLRKLFELND
jgi:uncharacterized protein (DUF1499 family)